MTFCSDGERGSCQIHGPPSQSVISDEISMTEMTTDCSKSSILQRSPGFLHSSCPPAMHKSCFCIRFIAEHTKITDDATKVIYTLSKKHDMKTERKTPVCDNRPNTGITNCRLDIYSLYLLYTRNSSKMTII